MRLLRRALRILLLLVVGLAGVLVLAIALLLVGANTGPGRRLIETEAHGLTGGLVTITGLHGRFPDRLRARTVTLADARGPYLTVDDLVLDWHPLALLGRSIDVDRLGAATIAVARLPVPSPAPAKPKGNGGGGVSLPFGLRLRTLAIDRVSLAAPVAGHAAAVGVQGHAAIASLAPILAGVSLDRLPRGTIGLALRDLAGRGQYRLSGDIAPGTIALGLDANEAAGGLVATFAGSGEISPLALHLALDGPTRAEKLRLALDAGPLHAGATGTVDLVDRAAAIDAAIHAPAMTPVAGVSWQSVALDAHVHGPFTTPSLAGTLSVRGLAAGGAAVGDLEADLAGDRGEASIRAVLHALRVPGPKPDLLASAPLTLDARARLDAPTRPVAFHVAHPLLDLAGTATTANGPIRAHAVLTLPALAPLAAVAGVDLAGHAVLTADATAAGPADHATVAARVGLTGGLPVAVALLGPDATLTFDAARDGASLSLRALSLRGRAIALDATGGKTGDVLDARARLALPRLRALSPAASGSLTVDLAAHGPRDDLGATVHATGDVGAHGVPPGPLVLDVAASHLPNAPTVRLTLGGTLDRAPVTVRATAARGADGATTIHLASLDWRSLGGHADLVLAPHATVPTGTVDLAMTRLADLSALAGQALAGSVRAKLALAGGLARVDIRADGIAAAGAHVGGLTLGGTVRNPQTAPVLDLRLAIARAGTAAIDGVSANATARGPLSALDSTLDAAIPDLKGAPAHLALADTLDLPRKTVTLRRLDADWHGDTVRLLAPTAIAWAPAVTVRRLRIALAPPPGAGAPALVALDGTVSPRLALSATISDVTPALAAPLAPTLRAAGRIDAAARLTGTPARPDGTVTVNATSLRLLNGPAASLPPAGGRARVVLAGGRARVDAAVDAGSDIALRVTGDAPVTGAGPIALRADGRVDLAVANPVLEQEGRHASGRLALDATATGTVAHPSLAGMVTLANGDVIDYAQGVHLSRIAADLALRGQTVRIDRFVAHAGAGTIEASGSVGALVPGIPVDIRLLMHDASPVASDLLSASLDADIAATGSVANGLRVAGSLTVDRADINIPNSLPSSVATLHVIKPGEKPPPAPGTATPSHPVALALALHAPGQIFVRGHGLDAVLGGDLTVNGDSAHPVIGGAFRLRRGTFSLAGTSLTFTRGNVGFNGTTNGRLDPRIDFVAESVVNQYTADLEVSGYASKPKITLSSTPSLPQDQVLALILFGTETSNLSPFQIAEIASALATLTGGGGGFDPLATVRNTLGLDRLSVGSGTGNGAKNSGASVEGGKYVTRNVYVGARQSTAGGGTQAVVQIDITKRLKAFTTVGTGGTVTGATTPENDPGSSVGLRYQFHY